MKIKIITLFVLLLSISNSFASDSFTVLEKGSDYIKIKFDTPEFNLKSIQTTEGSFITLAEHHSIIMLEKGKPSLPYYSFSLSIPEGAQVETSTKILSSEDQILNHPWAPSKGNLTRDINPLNIAYEKGAVYQSDVAFPGVYIKANDDFFIRDFHGLSFHVFPFQFTGANNKLEIVKSMEIIIKWDRKSLDVESSLSIENATYQEILSQQFLNIDKNTKYSPLSEEGNMLIICKDEWMNQMDEYIMWRTQSGIPTEIVSETEVGNTETDIFNYVENYYYTNGLTYLLIAGDVEVFPPRTAGMGGPSDQGYGYLVGNDHYPDIIVGRFSADHAWQLQTQIQRTLEYEKGELESFDWLKKTAGIASAQGPGDDNEMDYQHVRNLQTQLVSYTYTNPTYEFFDGSQGGYDAPNNPSGAMVKEALNDGAGALWYTGHGVVTGWSTSYFDSNDILDLDNAGKLPFIYSTACLVGAYDGDSACFAESWQRATRDGQPIGAVANFSSTILQPWSPPMQGQDEIVNILTESYSNNIKRTFGGLAVNGCYSMNEAYGNAADEVTDTWVVFGDPALMIRTDVPTQITATHDEFLLDGTDEITVSCNTDGARVVLSQGSEFITSSIVSGGQAVLNLEDMLLGESYQITISGFNCLPYFGQFVMTTSDPLIVMESYEINGEEALYYNQIQNINLSLSNVGINNSSEVTASLTSSDPYILNMTNNNNVSFGSIDGSGGIVESSNAFSVEISNEVPDQHMILFTLNVSEGSQSWEYDFEVPVNAPSLQLGFLNVNDEAQPPQFITSAVTQVNPGAFYEYNMAVEQSFGNGDQDLDAGDLAYLEVSIHNQGHAATTNFDAQMTCSNSNVSLITSSYGLSEIAAGESGTAIFEIAMDENTPAAEEVSFNVEAQAGFYSSSSNYSEVVGKISENFETGDFSYLNWQFSSSEWNVSEDSFNGSNAAISAPIDNNESTSLELTANFMIAGEISFYLRISSEVNADKCIFTIDGDELLSVSGEQDWQLYSFPVSAGSHLVKWTYTKDFIFANGEDQVWIDQISFPPFENEGNNIRFNATDLPAWLQLEDHYNGSATLSGTAPSSASVENIQLLASQSGATVEQNYNLNIGLVNTTINNMEEILIYPNPFTESIQLETQYENGFTLFVSDLQGKLIWLQTFPNSKTKVDLDMLQSGTYFIKIVSNGKVIEKKIMKI